MLSRIVGVKRARVLTLGSGDGSMPESIVRQGHRNVVATFYDTRAEVVRKYPASRATLQYLEEQLGPEGVRFGVDATALDASFDVRAFDLVIFYFPHTGVPNYMPRDSVSSNKMLLEGFLRSVPSVLLPGGEVHIALKTGQPYDQWGLDAIVEASTLRQRVEFERDPAQLPGYVHVMTLGLRGQRPVQDTGALVHVLELDETHFRDCWSPLVRMQAKLTIFVQCLMYDEDVEAAVLDVLHRHKADGMTSLELQRAVQREPQVEMCQINRVLKKLSEKRVAEKGSPRPAVKSQKPVWRVAL